MTVQEELSLGKKWNTNGDKDDQSAGRPPASTVRGSINSDLRDSISSIQGPIIKSMDLQGPTIKSLDLGSTDSSWMDAAGTMTDSEEEEDLSKEVGATAGKDGESDDAGEPGEPEANSFFGRVARLEVAVLQHLQDGTGAPGVITEMMRILTQVEGISPADVSERTDSGLGLNFENLELSLSRETLQLSRFE